MYKNKLSKYIKKLNQLGGEINPDFKMFESCIGKVRIASDSPTIKIRSREELLQYLIDKKSIISIEAQIINTQLRIIDEYIRDGERTVNKIKINPYDPRLGTLEEIILREVAKMSLMICKIKGQYPRDNQLIAVLQFLEGKNILLQAGTGQGKSLIVAMIAILQKRLMVPYNINDQRPMAVHVITVTNDLATDGRESNKALFNAYGYNARGINDKGNIDDIIYGTPYDFEAQALNEASDPRVPKQLLNNAVRRTIILDESDSHLVDNASGRVMTSDQDPSAQIVKDVIMYIANQTNDFFTKYVNYSILTGIKAITEMGDEYVNKKYSNFLNRWNSEKDVWILNAFKIFSPNTDYKPGVNFIMVKSLYNEIIDFGKYNPQINVTPLINIMNLFHSNYSSATILPRFKDAISKWSIREDNLAPESKSSYHRIVELISLIQYKTKEQVYGIVFMGAIQYLDIGTGQIINNMRFSNGVQELLEYKYFRAIFTEPTISVRSYSLYRYIRESYLIFGLSGTVGLDKETLEFQRKVWRIDKSPVILPEFAVPQLIEIKPSIHVNTIEEWHSEILKELRLRNIEQPVLIITENPDRARDVYNYLKTQSLNPSIYEASSDKHILEEKLGPNRIIITTNLGGRGSDYQYDSKLSPKGLHVIVGFDSDEERILAQARGRAGRAGNPGSWRKISFGSILRQKPDLNIIKNSVRNTIGEDVIFEIYLFIKEIINQQFVNKDILESRLTFLMSWLSKPDIRELLIKNITAKYNIEDDSVNFILSAFVLDKWSKDENSHTTTNYNESSPDSIKLSMRLKPHLVELKRLN
jgi:preprotein translocase subunit SecA